MNHPIDEALLNADDPYRRSEQTFPVLSQEHVYCISKYAKRKSCKKGEVNAVIVT